MARIDKRTRNRRLAGLFLVITVIVLALVLLIRLGCGGAEGDDTDGAEAPPAGDVTVAVGERVERGDAAITVTAFLATALPTLPPSAVTVGGSLQAGEGQTYHQAFVWIENAGDTPVRVDASDFFLLTDGNRVPPDLTRSGPAARTLLRGATLQMILTFIGPLEGTARLGYRSSWSQGTIIFEGQKKPAGMAQAGGRS